MQHHFMAGSPDIAELSTLLSRAKAGDAQAFERVYSQFFAPVYRYLARRVRDSRETDDLAQQVFLKLLTSRTGFDSQIAGGGPLAYLFTIARTTLVDYWKKKRPIEIIDSDISDKHDHGHDTRVTEDVRRALDILPAEQRVVIELKFLEGLTTGEIATRLSKTEAAIRQIQCRALRDMRQHII